MKWPVILLSLLAMSACAPEQARAPVGPASLQIVPPEYYSRTLHYQVRSRYRGRAVMRTYDIPIRINRETGDVSIADDGDKEKTRHQLDVIQWRLNELRGSLRSNEKRLQEDKRDAAIRHAN